MNILKLNDKALSLRKALQDNDGFIPDGHELEDYQNSFSGSSGFWYNLTGGGNLKPEDILGDKDQIAKVNEAVKLLEQFEELYEELAVEF